MFYLTHQYGGANVKEKKIIFACPFLADGKKRKITFYSSKNQTEGG